MILKIGVCVDALRKYYEYELSKKVRKAIREAKANEKEIFCKSFTEDNAHRKLKHLKPRPNLPECIHTEFGEQLTQDDDIATHLCKYLTKRKLMKCRKLNKMLTRPENRVLKKCYYST